MTAWTLILIATIANGARWGGVSATNVPGYASKADCEKAVDAAAATRRVDVVAFCVPGPR